MKWKSFLLTKLARWYRNLESRKLECLIILISKCLYKLLNEDGVWWEELLRKKCLKNKIIGVVWCKLGDDHIISHMPY